MASVVNATGRDGERPAAPLNAAASGDAAWYLPFLGRNLTVLGGHVLIYLRNLLLVPLIIKTSGPELYGGYVLVSSITGFLYGISSFGVGFQCSRELPSAPTARERRRLFYAQAEFHLAGLLLVGLVVLVASPLFRILLGPSATFGGWVAMLYLLTFFVYSKATDYFRFIGNVGRFNYATISYPYLAVLFILAAHRWSGHLSLTTLFLADAAAALVVGVPLVYGLTRDIGWRWERLEPRALLADAKLGFPLVASYVADVVLSSSDRYILAALLSVTVVGYYAPAYALGSLILLVARVGGVVVPPAVARAVDGGDDQRARQMLSLAVNAFVVLGIPFVVGATVLSEPLLVLFANREVADQAWMVTPIVAAASIFYGWTLILSTALYIWRRTGTVLTVNVVAAGVNLLLNVTVLVAFRHLAVAALTTLVSYTIAWLIATRIVNRRWRVGLAPGLVARAAAAALVMSGVLLVTGYVAGPAARGAVYVAVSVVAGILAYAACLGFLLRGRWTLFHLTEGVRR